MRAGRTNRAPSLAWAALALFLGAAPAGAEEQRWETYANARFGYSICYPADLLRPRRESDNSDGRRFTAGDGGVLTVYGANNALEQSIDALRRDVAERVGRRVTYASTKPDRFAISGFGASGEVFYVALRLREDQYASFELTYPRGRAAIYDKVAARIAACFGLAR